MTATAFPQLKQVISTALPLGSLKLKSTVYKTGKIMKNNFWWFSNHSGHCFCKLGKVSESYLQLSEKA